MTHTLQFYRMQIPPPLGPRLSRRDFEPTESRRRSHRPELMDPCKEVACHYTRQKVKTYTLGLFRHGDLSALT